MSGHRRTVKRSHEPGDGHEEERHIREDVQRVRDTRHERALIGLTGDTLVMDVSDISADDHFGAVHHFGHVMLRYAIVQTLGWAADNKKGPGGPRTRVRSGLRSCYLRPASDAQATIRLFMINDP